MVVSQYEKSTTIYYTLRAYSCHPFEFKEILLPYVSKLNVNGEWKGSSAGGCQNNMATYKCNPKYALTLNEGDANIVIELRGPKVYQVGLELIVSSLEDPNITAPFISKTTGNFRSGYCVLDLDQLPAGIYHIIPSTFLPGQESPFILSIRSSTKAGIERIN